MKNIISFFCVFGVSIALATEVYQNQVAIDSVAESVNSKKGIEISGTVRGISYNSDVSSKQEKALENGSYPKLMRMPDKEIAEFVQLDLNFLFRPWDNVRANLKLRMGAGMQEYFAAAQTLVNGPWMNIEGNAADGTFYWVVGDFRQLYSPLTLYAPGVDIMYEPTVFARKREIAAGDALLQGNKRNLQGFNLQFRPSFGETLGELRVEALGARLRRAGYLDSTGAMGNILPNENIPGSSQAGTFDKFLLGGNLEYLPLNKNILVGGSYLMTFDEKRSALKRPDGSFINLNDTLPQNTQVFSGRVGFDLAAILDIPNLIANATGEYAGSSDKVYEDAYKIKTDDDGNQIMDGEEFVYEFDKTINKQSQGSAILASLDVGYKEKGSFKALLSGKYIKNDSAWFNPLAQSPQFVPRRILNSDKDSYFTKYGVYSPLYSTFDALYNFTPKHSPMPDSGYLDNMGLDRFSQSNSYNIAPYAKSSWSTATLNRAELALVEELSDVSLQTALPNGFATANRTGVTGTLTLGYGDYIEAKGLFTSLEQSSADLNAKPAVYTEFGGGAKIDVLGFVGFENNPLELSGSYRQLLKEQDWEVIGKSEFKSDFINAGLYYRFFRKFGLTAGYQKINSTLNTQGVDAARRQSAGFGFVNVLANKTRTSLIVVPVMESVQDQWMAGLDYTVAPHAWLSINYGIMSVENTYNSEGLVGEDGVITTGTNLPNYISLNKAEPEAKELKHKFSRNVLEAAINVEF